MAFGQNLPPCCYPFWTERERVKRTRSGYKAIKHLHPCRGGEWMNLAKNKKAFHTVTLFLINLKALIFFQGNVQSKNGAKSLHWKRFGRHKHRSVPSGDPWGKDFLSVSQKQQRLLQAFRFPWHVTEFVCRKRLIEHRKRYVLTMLKEFSADMHV